MTILGLSRSELTQISLILFLIILATLINLKVSFRKSRDAQRKADVRSLYDALMLYQDQIGAFPFSSEDGKIIACRPDYDDQGLPHYQPCEWYRDNLEPFLANIPGDPRQGQGRSYYYLSNSRHFQLYASLESSSEAEYDPAIVDRGLLCGQYLCNFGRSDGATPLDKSLEAYENELREDEK